MNVNRKFLDEAIMLSKRWKDYPLLGGIPEQCIQKPNAVVLESQRLCYERAGGCEACEQKDVCPIKKQT
jgi:hypothetical protein